MQVYEYYPNGEIESLNDEEINSLEAENRVGKR